MVSLATITPPVLLEDTLTSLVPLTRHPAPPRGELDGSPPKLDAEDVGPRHGCFVEHQEAFVGNGVAGGERLLVPGGAETLGCPCLVAAEPAPKPPPEFDFLSRRSWSGAPFSLGLGS